MANLSYSGTLIYLVILLSRDTEQILLIPIPLAFVLNSDFLNDPSSLCFLLSYALLEELAQYHNLTDRYECIYLMLFDDDDLKKITPSGVGR